MTDTAGALACPRHFDLSAARLTFGGVSRYGERVVRHSDDTRTAHAPVMHEPRLIDFLGRHPHFASGLARYLAQPARHTTAVPVRTAQPLAVMLHRGDVLLTEGISRMAAIVRRFTGSTWSHVAMYVGPLEAGPNPRCVVEADVAAGVRAVPLSEFDGIRVRVLRPVRLHDAERRRLADWVTDRIGDSYDLAHAFAMARGLLGLRTTTGVRSATSAIEHGNRRFVCSTLVAQAFTMVGHPIAPTQIGIGQGCLPDHRYVTPRDFEQAPVFEVVNRDA